MTDGQQLSFDLGKPHRNHYLFSDYYLEEILRREPAWEAARPRAAEVLAFLRDLYANEAAQLPAYSEAQLEERWIKPLLGQLGHVWEPQAAVPGLDKGIKKPDYVFFADETTRRAAVADQRTEEYARRALAVGEVKAWPVHLSRKSAGAPTFDNNNPMFQIDYYLKSTGAAWGIVSNGHLWRLVQRDSSYKLDVYFEIDLLEALTTADERRALAVANYLVVFFGQAAFRPDARGTVFLDDVLRGSRTYAVALESDLRDNAYKALEQLITGFFAPAVNQLDPNDPADRERVYRNSLLLLYRLLFLFYGESRGLLPMGNQQYRERSLSALARDVARLVDDHRIDALPPMTGQQWARLRELFAIIDGGDAQLNAYLGVPRYNGGLFDPDRHAFLEAHFVGDRHLARAIDYLARRRKSENGRYVGFEAVDYRTLGVRQLGSIYEGLLEYKVSVATEAMVTVRKGGKETWLPAGERGQARAIESRAPGELYLATDKGERKATGSYYTPDYIVKYIVEQTLGPLVEEARNNAKAPRGKDANAKAQRGKDAKEEEGEESVSSFASSRHSAFALTSSSESQRFEEAILALNVLDPAMGSGHFLVEATDFLARALATSDLAGRGDGAGDGEADLTYWRRRIVEACIYGVDKNELAVELAKLSLWLVTVAADKPLSFLDHHLRHGDSLIGAWLRDLEGPPTPSPSGRGLGRGRGGAGAPGAAQSEPLFDEPAFTTNVFQAVGGAARIEAILTDNLDAVHDKERLLRQMRDEHLGRWRRLADLWVSATFGNAMSAAEYADLARRIQSRPGVTMSDEQAARYLAHPAVVANDYFHWELEFPEVFFDEYGRPKGERAGFDAVVGNPPYLNAWSMTKDFPDYRQAIATLYTRSNRGEAEFLEGHWDFYSPFIVRALSLTNSHSLHSFIIPNPFLREKYTIALRRHFLADLNLISLLHFDETNVFDEVSRLCVAYVVAMDGAENTATTSVRKAIETTPSLQFGEHQVRRDHWLQSYNSQIRTDFSYVSGLELLAKIEEQSDLLGQHLYVNVGATLSSKAKGEFDKSDLVSLQPTGNAKRFFTGENVSRWVVRWGGEWLDYRQDELSGPRTPELFEANKLIVRSRTGEKERLIAAFDGDDLFCNNTLILCCPYEALVGSSARLDFPGYERANHPAELYFVLGLLNSTLMSWVFRMKFATSGLQGTYSDVWPQSVRAMPIRRLQLPTDGEVREQGKAAALSLYKSVFTTSDFSSALSSANESDLPNLLHDVLCLLVEGILEGYREQLRVIADFWTDLEGATDPTTFRKLRDRGKQEAGLAADPALAPFVRAGSKSSRSLDDALAWDEAAFKALVRALAGKVDGLSGLLRVYQRYAPPYAELVTRIARTDTLIDQIVYKLYGLSDEEIAIVEGRG